MADGSRKPIKDVRVGDRVLATDPTMGETAVRLMTDVRERQAELNDRPRQTLGWKSPRYKLDELLLGAGDASTTWDQA